MNAAERAQRIEEAAQRLNWFKPPITESNLWFNNDGDMMVCYGELTDSGIVSMLEWLKGKACELTAIGGNSWRVRLGGLYWYDKTLADVLLMVVTEEAA